MNRSIALAPPAGMSFFIDSPPLAGNETRAQYDELYTEIVYTLKPSNAVVWLCVGRVADCAWYMRRERMLKMEIIKFYGKIVISEILRDSFVRDILGGFDDEVNRWEADPETTTKLNAVLAKKGYTPDAVLAQAYLRGADQIEASDRRFAMYESRASIALKEASIFSELLRERIDCVVSKSAAGALLEAPE